jgi:hypothetical protein
VQGTDIGRYVYTWIMHTAGLPNAGRAWLMSSRIE